MFKYIVFAILCCSLSVSNAATYQVRGGSLFSDGSIPLTAIDGGGAFVEGVFDGSASTCCLGVNDASATVSGLQSFTVLSGTAYSYFASTGVDGAVHSAPTIDLTSMTADMSSFYIFWNGNEIYQGDMASVTDLGGGVYELTWTGIESGPKVSTIFDWTMQVSAVPVPAALWLFGSGLFGLAAFARCRNET